MGIVKQWVHGTLAAVTCATACIEDPQSTAGDEPVIAQTSAALAGRDGKIEYALDAPFRLEPVGSPDNYDHGPIPISISVHDALQAADDQHYDWIRDFQSLEITEKTIHGTASRSVSFGELREVEVTRGAWQLTGTPEHDVCEPVNEVCSHVRSLEGSSSWHATYWYTPATGARAGEDIQLAVELRVAAGLIVTVETDEDDPQTGIGDSTTEVRRAPGTLRLKEHLKVHLGEAPLPRFGEGWLYGDLHYHSQNTDNEGEAGYGYRATLRAMGALGLDFAFATEHASNSEQITDFDLFTGREYGALRDMSPDRFRFALESLHGERGANRAVLSSPGGVLPQTVRGRGIAPQLYLGGEVDAIPEVSRSEVGEVSYGNGLRVNIRDFCIMPEASPLPWPGESIADCDAWDNVRESPYGGYGVVGWAGFREEFTRQHLVYMPRDERDQQAFVASNTGAFGGAQRWLPDVLEDIEAHGDAFLAHPLTGPTTDFLDAGPDAFPYTELQLSRAFASPGILGLQLWNEDPRLETTLGEGQSYNNGLFDKLSLSAGRGTCTIASGYPVDCLLELAPQWRTDGFQWQRSGTPTYGAEDTSFAMPRDERGMYSDLHHGTFTLDGLLRKGLDPAQTAQLPWLAAGEPRRVFLAAGSDAHGDLGFRREGYFFGTNKVSSTAIGTPRNLVFAGPVRGAPLAENEAPPISQVGSSQPSKGSTPVIATGTDTKGGAALVPVSPVTPNGDPGEVLSPRNPTSPVRYSQSQVTEALRDGNFSMTDGPALRIVIDRNKNGVVDATDIPMGGIGHLYDHEDVLPLLVEWSSTAEFGPVAEIDLYVGSVRNNMGRTYAPAGHGVRTQVDPQSGQIRVYEHQDGQVHVEMADHYFRDPTGQLRIQLPTQWGERLYQGVRAVNLDLRRFPARMHASEGAGSAFYVRAFAKTEPEEWSECIGPGRELNHRLGRCIERLAYTNPVWALRRDAESGCAADPRAIDRDDDGKPDHCDVCPDAVGPTCNVLPPDGDDWSRRFGGPQMDEAQAVAIDDQGSVFVAGHFQGSVSHGTKTYVSQGAHDGFIAKFGAEGNLVWVKQLAGGGDMRIMDIKVDALGNPVVTGWFNGDLTLDENHVMTAVGDDVFVANFHGRHYLDKPVLRWSRQFSGPGRTTGLALAIAENGRTYVGGSFEGSIAAGGGGIGVGDAASDCYAFLLGPGGDFINRLHMGGPGQCEVAGLAVDGQDLIVAGRYTGEVRLNRQANPGIYTSQSGWNGFVARYREGTYHRWSTSLGDNAAGCASADASVTGLDRHENGVLYVSGYAKGCLGARGSASSASLASALASYQAFVTRFSPDGEVFAGVGLGLPGLPSGSESFAFDVAATADGGYAVAGSTSVTQTSGKLMRSWRTGWVAQYSPSAQFLWSESFGTSGQSYGFSCDVDEEGYVAVAGRFAQTLEIGDAAPLPDLGAGDAFVSLLAP